uniref:Uncharacterized protein n=1 Tax=Ditylenchus dipsaci TaxID=166011 RepID=A0A915E2T8_9BILA
MRASQRSSKGLKDQVSDKKEFSRRVQLASKHHSEYCIGDDSLSNMSSQSEIITANSPSVTSPQLSMMNESYVRKKGWQDSNGVPWTKSPYDSTFYDKLHTLKCFLFWAKR